jgi:hypothetical protein
MFYTDLNYVLELPHQHPGVPLSAASQRKN